MKKISQAFTVRWNQPGEQGFGIVTNVVRDNFTESAWKTYGTIGHVETWNNTSANRNGARSGDLFTVSGTATNTGVGHTATYRCTNDSGDLAGTCIGHVKSGDGGLGLWALKADKASIPVFLDSNGNVLADIEENVYLSLHKLSDGNYSGNNKTIQPLVYDFNGMRTRHNINYSGNPYIQGDFYPTDDDSIPITPGSGTNSMIKRIKLQISAILGNSPITREQLESIGAVCVTHYVDDVAIASCTIGFDFISPTSKMRFDVTNLFGMTQGAVVYDGTSGASISNSILNVPAMMKAMFLGMADIYVSDTRTIGRIGGESISREIKIPIEVGYLYSGSNLVFIRRLWRDTVTEVKQTVVIGIESSPATYEKWIVNGSGTA